MFFNWGFDITREPDLEYLNEPRCPQCGATSHWINQEFAAECKDCKTKEGNEEHIIDSP
jgi:hypothetical protein